MIKKKYKAKQGEMPAYVLVHYRQPDGIYNFKITVPEKALGVKNAHIQAGMTDVTIPIFDYRDKQALVGGGELG